MRLDAAHNRELAVSLCDAFLWGCQRPEVSAVAAHSKYPQGATEALCLAVLAASAATEGRELTGESRADAESVSAYNTMNVRSLRSMIGQVLGGSSPPASPLCTDITRLVDRLASDVETEFRDDDE